MPSPSLKYRFQYAKEDNKLLCLASALCPSKQNQSQHPEKLDLEAEKVTIGLKMQRYVL